ncbi:MAG: FKBP-type peptidyl-prolyl cis-trans isomerase [Lachnospiraceae bacterium]|nr:FKBP-type peptidyl-prolyl cis-trans isomerase [Lachnospiraceae bacterium]
MNDSELKEINDTIDTVEEAAEELEDAVDTVQSSDEKKTEPDKSHSQQKREQRRKEVAQARRRARSAQIIGYISLAVVAALIVWGVAVLIMKQMDKVSPNENYSDGLEATGYISGVKASDKITLPDYKNISVPYAEIEFKDDEIDAEIENLLSGYNNLNTDEAAQVKDGDDVEIAYVGTIDGAEFEGGSSESYKLTIGSGTFIPGFEDQLIGANVGSTVEVNVTFPEDYRNADVAGKDAVFTVDVKGVYEDAVFDDEFVKTNLSDKASTADGYREYVRSTHEDENLETYLKDYLKENTTVNSYPSKYLKALKGIKMYDDQQSYEYMNQFYQNYYGSAAYDSFESYIGTSMNEYYQTLKEQAKETCKENMIYQAIVEQEGATADAAYYRAKLVADGQTEDYYDTLVTTSGEPFVLQQAIAAKALEIVKAGASVQK